MKEPPAYSNCSECGEEIKLTACQRWAIRRRNRKNVFCQTACYQKFKQGAGNPNWRGGRRPSGDGYIYVFAPDHPNKNKDRQVFEHRIIMEQMLGRYLSKEEVVHHINGIGTDNRPENLRLFKSEAEHRKLHVKYRTRRKDGKIKGHQEGVLYYV